MLPSRIAFQFQFPDSVRGQDLVCPSKAPKGKTEANPNHRCRMPQTQRKSCWASEAETIWIQSCPHGPALLEFFLNFLKPTRERRKPVEENFARPKS